MREIKFRAWDKKAKKMFYNVHELYDGYGNITDREGNELDSYEIGAFCNASFNNVLQDQDFEVSQYTGLKDKNGKEIYEGDVVRSHIFAPNLIYTVKYEDEGYYFPFTIAARPELCEKSEYVEIIGNIYENPELLKRYAE